MLASDITGPGDQRGQGRTTVPGVWISGEVRQHWWTAGDSTGREEQRGLWPHRAWGGGGEGQRERTKKE